MRTTQETKAALVAKIKSLGFNSRQVSVSTERLSLDEAFNVTIRDEKVDKAVIKEAVKEFESIDRDHSSGEILSGGNTYVTVRDRVGRLL